MPKERQSQNTKLLIQKLLCFEEDNWQELSLTPGE